MPDFKLLTRYPLVVVAYDTKLSTQLRAEGYDVRSTTPGSRFSWLRFATAHILFRRRYHWLVESPLSQQHESGLAIVVRYFRILIRSWTRVDDGFSSSLESRLLQLAERDYNQGSNKGRHHERLEIQQRTAAKPATEFDRLLEASPP